MLTIPALPAKEGTQRRLMCFMSNLVGLNQKDLGHISYLILVPRSMSSAGKTPALRAATHPASLEMLFSKIESCSHKSNYLIHGIADLS